MSRTDRVEAVAADILRAFETGAVPAALKQIFLDRSGRPSSKWSFSNQMLAVLHGHVDARGFRQWKNVGRSVRKGERAFHILGPITRRATARDVEDDDSLEIGDPIVRGFRPIPVFTYLQTEGEPLADHVEDAALLDRLPLLDVARAWDLAVQPRAGHPDEPLGQYLAGLGIILAVENLATWAHELIHAADDRLGTLAYGTAQEKAAAEVVAELGGAVLLECVGETVASDRGGALRYIRNWSQTTGRATVAVCTGLIDRVCRCVQLVLDTADRICTEEAA